MNILSDQTVAIDEKVFLMKQDARFDVADDDQALLPDPSQICQEIRAGRSHPTVPKVFLSNDCAFNCSYCGCRSGNMCKRKYVNTPRELAELAVKQADSSGHGIFITSAVLKTPDYTQELIVETLRIIRRELGYRGYVHAKVMPGVDPELIYQSGRYANRLSVNIEVAKSEGYAKIAKNKSRKTILTPMGQISSLIQSAQAERKKSRYAPAFASSQTTQLMAGSIQESDRTILTLSSALYEKYKLKRVYYTSFQYKQPAAGYEGLETVSTPLWRMRRLYQADRLMHLYGFAPGELLTEESPNLQEELDPKAAWVLRNLHLYPIEVNTADFEQLLRIPGIGIFYAQRIVKIRKSCAITHDILRSLGVPLKRSGPFLTCRGKLQGVFPDSPEMLWQLLADSKDAAERQLTLPEGYRK